MCYFQVDINVVDMLDGKTSMWLVYFMYIWLALGTHFLATLFLLFPFQAVHAYRLRKTAATDVNKLSKQETRKKCYICSKENHIYVYVHDYTLKGSPYVQVKII